MSKWTFDGRHGNVEVGLYEVGRGNIPTAAAVPDAIREMDPQVAVFIGVGGALKGAPAGDVIAVDKAINPRWGKEDKKKGFLSRTHAENSSPYLVELARAVAGDKGWHRRLPRGSGRPRVLVEPAASTDAVVANSRSETARLIARVAGEAEVVEMEGLGFLSAANRAHRHALIIRGISDGQDDKEQLDKAGVQGVAAGNAAAFAFELISRIDPGGLPGGLHTTVEVGRRPVPAWPEICKLEFVALNEENPDAAKGLLSAAGSRPRHQDKALRQLLHKPPPWMASAPPRCWILLAYLGGAYGFPGPASAALEKAADLGAPRPQSLLARAALYAIDGGDSADARRLLGRAAEYGADPFVEMVDGWLEGDMQTAMEASQRVGESDTEEFITARSLLAATRERLGDPGAALRECEVLVSRFPDRAGLKISPSQFLLRRAQRGGPSRPADLDRAAELLGAVRDNRRLWGGDSATPTALLAEVLMEAGDLEEALNLAAGGAADGGVIAQEFNSPLVIEAGAKAAVMLGRTSVAQDLVRRLPNGSARATFEGMLAKRVGGPKEAAVAAFWNAFALADNPGRQFASLYHLATLGEDVTEPAAALRAVDTELGERVLAALESSRGEHQQAVARLRGWAHTSMAAAEALSQAHIAADQIDAAIVVLEQAAKDWNAPQLLIEAIDLLRLEPNPQEVRRLGSLALEKLPPRTSMRRHVVGRLLEVAGREGDWEMVVARAAELQKEGDDRDEIRWASVLGNLHLSALDQALEAMQQPALLEPKDEYRAGVQIYLLCHLAPGTDTVRRVLELCRLFDYSEEVRAMALNSIYTMRPQEPLAAPELADLHAQTAAFAREYPHSAALKIVTVPKDDPETAIARMEALVGAPPAALVELTSKVVAGEMPLGILASMQRRPYAGLLISGGTGRLFAVDPQSLEEETAAAAAALDRDLIIDLSSLDMACRLVDWPDLLRGAFRRIRVTDLAVRDALHARDDLRLRSTLSLVREKPDQQMTLVATSPDVAEDLAQRSERLAEVVRSFRQVACRSLPHFPVCDVAVEGSWLGGIEVAADQGSALLCDDVLLRQMARELGVPSFCTLALMRALARAQRLSDDDLAEYWIEMVRQNVVDLPFDPVQLHAVAAENDYKMGPALIAFGRPSVWTEPEAALTFLMTACDRAAKHGLDVVLPWYDAALQGVERYPPATAAGFATALIHAAWRALIYDPDALVPMLRMARLAVERVGGADPLPVLSRQLADALRPRMPEDQVLLHVLQQLGKLAESDRGIALMTLIEK